MVKRALISVSDKTDIMPLAETLQRLGCDIISTGGTLRVLKEGGVQVRDISTVTKNPEVFGGRVKTLSFQTSSAILFDRDRDAEEAEKYGIDPIDLVVCNCYPFEEVDKQNAEFDCLIENIDIGGPTMIRSAAKNFAHVAVVTDPKDYSGIIKELDSNNGELSKDTRKQLMRKAFNYTADYDAAIAVAMDRESEKNSVRLSFTEGVPLRYGENSHQKAFFYKEKSAENSLYDMEILHGKQLSFNNLMDINSAIDALRDLHNSACAVIKHNTPCGLSESKNQEEALALAWQGDPVSAFGSVISFNKEVEGKTVDFFQLSNPDRSQRKFIEVIVAPEFTPEALEKLRVHKNLRLVKFKPQEKGEGKELRYFKGSLLLQENDEELFKDLNCVTKTKTESCSRELMEFGLKSVRQVKSNAIVVVRQQSDATLQLLGMGAGQPNRLTSVSLAVAKCRDNLAQEFKGEPEDLEAYIQKELARSLLVSEAFFPFPDSVEICGDYGIKTILQPGGSIRDDAVVAECDRRGITMVMTGLRHFKH